MKRLFRSNGGIFIYQSRIYIMWKLLEGKPKMNNNHEQFYTSVSQWTSLHHLDVQNGFQADRAVRRPGWCGTSGVGSRGVGLWGQNTKYQHLQALYML